jgi:D-3-phosphoglycerate dehydrogenase / 2-oxoglutarate reductase
VPLDRVIVTEPIHEAGIQLLIGQVEVVRPGAVDQTTLAALIPEASAMIVRLAKVPAELLAKADKLLIVGKHGVGVDNIDLKAATERGVVVTNTPVATEGSVAEHALTMMLVLSRRLRECEQGTRAGRFFETRDGTYVEDLAGKTLGIVGVGRIGARLAEICRAGLRMRVVASDPYVSDERLAAMGAERRNLDGLLAEADFVSVHVPLTDSTRGMIGAKQLAAMKPTAFVLNCARGGIVDELALAEALEAGRIAGAGIDTWAQEPPDPSHPLFSVPNVVLTPHVAGGSQDALRLTAVTVAEEVLSVLRGEAPRFVVNKDVAGRERRRR